MLKKHPQPMQHHHPELEPSNLDFITPKSRLAIKLLEDNRSKSTINRSKAFLSPYKNTPNQTTSKAAGVGGGRELREIRNRENPSSYDTIKKLRRKIECMKIESRENAQEMKLREMMLNEYKEKAQKLEQQTEIQSALQKENKNYRLELKKYERIIKLKNSKIAQLQKMFENGMNAEVERSQEKIKTLQIELKYQKRRESRLVFVFFFIFFVLSCDFGV
jgi:hypothetical protein